MSKWCVLHLPPFLQLGERFLHCDFPGKILFSKAMCLYCLQRPAEELAPHPSSHTRKLTNSGASRGPQKPAVAYCFGLFPGLRTMAARCSLLLPGVRPKMSKWCVLHLPPFLPARTLSVLDIEAQKWNGSTPDDVLFDWLSSLSANCRCIHVCIV